MFDEEQEEEAMHKLFDAITDYVTRRDLSWEKALIVWQSGVAVDAFYAATGVVDVAENQ